MMKVRYGQFFFVVLTICVWAGCGDNGNGTGTDTIGGIDGGQDGIGADDGIGQDGAGSTDMGDAGMGDDVEGDSFAPPIDTANDDGGAVDTAVELDADTTGGVDTVDGEDGEDGEDGTAVEPDADISEEDTAEVAECGDGVCNGEESCATCPTDCGSCLETCGNGTCGSGETCTSCPQDCGTCPAVCGNGFCEAGEGCASCAADCACTEGGQVCYSDACCTPSCAGITCGSDGCGGICDKCVFNTVCNVGAGLCETGTASCGDTSVFQPGSPWPTHGYCASHQGRSPLAGPATNSVKWTFTAGGAISASPVIAADGTIYVGSKNGKFYAINPDGTEKWAYDTGKPIESSASIGADSTVYVGSNNGTLYAFTPKGNIKWSAKVGGAFAVLRGTNLGQGVVTIGVHNDNDTKGLHTLTFDGLPKWTFFKGDGDVFTVPAIDANGNMYLALSSSSDYVVWGIKPDGNSLFSTGQSVSAQMSPPSVGSGNIVYYKANGVRAYNTQGTLQWSADTEVGQSEGGMAIDGNKIIVGGAYGQLVAMDTNGKKLWSFAAGAPASAIRTTPAVDKDGVVYFGADNMRVYAVTNAGVEKWSYLTGNKVYSSPAIGKGGLLVVGSEDGKLYAFGQ
ncbi:MAG: PQQ-binding-like beta-propeller repeat protein [Myxococcales bacterium]|nr:PQQ-binding-like beta-propeller repeat protein [Myxococcales bacterium]